MSSRGWLLGLFVLVLSREAPAAPRAVERFAIVIGNNHSRNSAGPVLRYADDDAVATHRLLQTAGVQSFLLVTLDDDSRRMYPELTPNGPPSGKAIETTFVTLSERIRKAAQRGHETELLFFYSGHGDVEGGEGFVTLEDDKLTRRQLFALLSSSLATRNHVFIDACKSYFLAFDRGPGGRRTPYSGELLTESIPAELKNTGFVLSTSSDRDSHEWERYQGGILSHELRSALHGAADANLDGSINYAELGAFLTVANGAIKNPRFRPDFLVRPPGGNLERTILSWRGGAPSFFFGAGDWGHIYIETAEGDRLLDAHPAPNQALALWGFPQPPLFIRRHDGLAEYVVTTSEPLVVPNLVSSQSELATKGALHVALERLFEPAFSGNEVALFARDAREATRDRSPTPARQHTVLRTASGALALAAGATGLAMSMISLATYMKGRSASQQQTAELNEQVRNLNQASLVFYGVSALSGAVWGVATLWPDQTGTASPTQLARLRPGAFIDVRFRF